MIEIFSFTFSAIFCDSYWFSLINQYIHAMDKNCVSILADFSRDSNTGNDCKKLNVVHTKL